MRGKIKIKKPATSYSRMGESHTTLGDEALDFRVRNGNGYDSLSIVTGKKFAVMETKEKCNVRCEFF